MLMRQARSVHISVVCLPDANARIVRSDTRAQVTLINAAGAERQLRALMGAQLIVLERKLNLTRKGFGNV